MKVIAAIVCALCFSATLSRPAQASILVDFSPDTTGVSTSQSAYNNQLLRQNVGDRFDWAGGTITGGSIFSTLEYGSVGDSVRFVILDAFGAGANALIDVTTTLDAVDTQFTTSDTNLTRKHASIGPTFLAAGTYWFTMPGVDVNIFQASGNYDDNTFGFGSDANPDLNSSFPNTGDAFFQIEGNHGAVPEPATVAMWSLMGLCGVGYGVRRKMKKAA